ncbi:proliferating cell nuclear antigen (pcna) [Candidatus Micrarchaeota archaeon]|nr:proliferating cell nuclear antigen (pcna) [Candidatus Micrarchaeota archaeon]
MQLTFKDAKFFKQCIDAIVHIVDEGSFEVSSEGMRLRSLDPSQIALVDFHLPKAHAFSEFEVDGARTLSLNLVDLSKVLARSRGKEKLTLRLNDEERNKVQLDFVSDAKRSFKLPLLDLRDTAMPRQPKVPFAASVTLRAGQFKDMLKDAALVSSHLQLETTEHAFIVEAHGDAGDLKIEMMSKQTKELEVKTDGEQKAMYPSEYLDKMCRAAVDLEPLVLEFKSNHPVKMSYQIGDAQFTFFLAPRVESA